MKNVECFLSCLLSSDYLFGILALGFFSFFILVGYFVSRDCLSKVKYYWLFNILLLSSTPVIYLTMSCDMAWFVEVYIAYIITATALLLSIPLLYRFYLMRKYGIERFEELEGFLRDASSSKNSRLFILGSSLPKAFTLGRDVFLTAGIIELLNPDELRAVLAHEAFHVRQNKYPLIRNLRILTFLPGIRLEEYADIYAEKIAGKKALESAKERVARFYHSYDIDRKI